VANNHKYEYVYVHVRVSVIMHVYRPLQRGATGSIGPGPWHAMRGQPYLILQNKHERMCVFSLIELLNIWHFTDINLT
jgi:hypothetical protein